MEDNLQSISGRRDPSVLSQLFFLLFSISLALLTVSGLNEIAMWFMDIDATALQNLDQSFFDNLTFFKLLQMGFSIVMFVFPALAFSKYVTGSWLGYFDRIPPLKSQAILYIFLAIPLFFPLLIFLMKINSYLVLPESLSHIEQAIIEAENNAESLATAFLKMDSVGGLFFNLILIALLPAVGEELLFRGCIQKWLEKALNRPHLAIFIGGCVFSFFHFQFYGFLPRWAIGIFLGYLYYWGGHIIYPIIGHFFHNGMQVLAVYFNVSSVEEVGTQSLPDLDVSFLLTTFAFGSLFFIIAYLYKRAFKNESLTAQKNWKRILTTQHAYQADIAKAVLAENGIESMIMNKQDSVYVPIGEVELYVLENEVVRAIHLTKEIGNE